VATALRRLAALVAGAAAALWLVGERGHLMLPSTRALLREMGQRRPARSHFWHAYVYGRWTKQYLGWAIKVAFPRIHPVAGRRRWADQYHGKIVPTEWRRRSSRSATGPAPGPGAHQPYATAREIVLSGRRMWPLRGACRAARPTLPADAGLHDRRTAVRRFVWSKSRHQPPPHQMKPSAAGGERAGGHIHAAYFRDVM